MDSPRDFDVGAVRRLTALETELASLRAQISNAGFSQGSWTPVWAGSTVAGVYTYTNQAGTYKLVGNLLFFCGRLTISAIGTPPTGVMTITGLPVATLNSATSRLCVSFGLISQFNYAANAISLQGFAVGNSTTILLTESFDNAAQVQVPAANFTNAACDLIFSGWYPTS